MAERKGKGEPKKQMRLPQLSSLTVVFQHHEQIFHTCSLHFLLEKKSLDTLPIERKKKGIKS